MASLLPYTSTLESYNFTRVAYNIAPGQGGGVSTDGSGLLPKVLHYGSQGAGSRQVETIVSPLAPVVSTTTHGSSSASNVEFQLDQKDKDAFTEGLSYRLFNDYFEFGVKSSSEVFVEEWLLNNPILVQMCISQLYIDHCKDERVLIGLLKIIAHADRDSLVPISNIVSIAALSHSSIEVRECGIRAFEYWEDSSMADLLQSTHVEPAWLEEYKLDVVSSLKKG